MMLGFFRDLTARGGPYRLVRHPIYSGILVAGVGTAVTLSWLWLIAMAQAGIYFVYSPPSMSTTWPGSSPPPPAYKHSTKMLVPYMF